MEREDNRLNMYFKILGLFVIVCTLGISTPGLIDANARSTEYAEDTSYNESNFDNELFCAVAKQVGLGNLCFLIPPTPCDLGRICI